MTWTGLDIAVVGVAALNFVVLGGVVSAVLKIVRGPVAGLKGRTLSLVPKGKRLAETGQDVFFNNKDRVLALLTEINETRHLLNVDAFIPSPEGAVVTVASVAGAIRTVKTVRSGVGGALHVLRRIRSRRGGAAGNVANVPGKRGALPPKQSLAMRLGLIPPVARHLPVVMRVIGIARSVLAARKNLGGS